nr:DUF1801 domain-containing protein [Xanthomonas sp.]
MAALEHPLKDVVLALRSFLLGIDPSIGEEVKWNAPSFRTSGHFATLQLRSPTAVQLILHLGAKKRALPPGAIADPGGLLTWLGADRASLGFASKAELAAKQAALQAIVRQWIAHVGGTAE